MLEKSYWLIAGRPAIETSELSEIGHYIYIYQKYQQLGESLQSLIKLK